MGKVLIVEGPDGVGKTTFIEDLTSALRDQGFDVERVTPFSTPNGPKLLTELQSGEGNPLMLSRKVSKSINAVIEHCIEQPDKIFLMDRGYLSTIAEQGILDGNTAAYKEVTNRAYDAAVAYGQHINYLFLTAPQEVIDKRLGRDRVLDSRERKYDNQRRYDAYKDAAKAMAIIYTSDSFHYLDNHGTTREERMAATSEILNKMS